MSTNASQDPAPPPEVIAEFLHALQLTIHPHDQTVPVLRGSTLMNRWFGDAARPAADIDLEWFPQTNWACRRFASPLEQARGLLLFALGDHHGSPINFDPDIPVPSDGVNLALWDYSTPGLRCYTGWTWNDRNLRGVLQIDIAQAGSYDLLGVIPQTIELPRALGEPAQLLSYSPEMLLAAKLSWIVRSVKRATNAEQIDTFAFRGEAKDLFDAHLLLTKGNLRLEVFQNAFFAVAMEDKLDWNQINVLLDNECAMSIDGFSSFADFFNRYSHLLPKRPSEMMQTLIARLGPLLGDLREHVPFLRSIEADPTNEVCFLIYADWLEDRNDPRYEFLRLFCAFFFHDNKRARTALASMLSAQSGGWLYHVFGGAERSRELRRRIAKS